MSLPFSQPNYFDSSETGAPTLNNVAGSLLAVLRACLISGFNAKSVTSITVASGVATATAASHGYLSTYGKLLLIEGSTEPLLNGRKQPLSVAANTFTYAAPGVADGTYTGTISAKRAPLGWTEPHTGTNVAMFARSAPEATAMLLRVNDSGANGATATDARAIMVESATGIDTHTAPCPTVAQLSGGQYINKGVNNATAKQWTLVGDGRRFFLVTQLAGTVLPSAGGSAAQMFFGDFTSLKAGDAYNTLLCAGSSAYVGSVSNSSIIGNSTLSPNSASIVVARAYTQIGGAMHAGTFGLGVMPSGDPSGPVYPSPVDSGCVMLPGMLVREAATTNPVRGILKPLVQFYANYPFAHGQIVEPIEQWPGRKVLALAGGSGSLPVQFGVDLTGPWD